QFPPAIALHAEPALLADEADPIAGHVHALGARVGDEAFEPVAVAHEAVPGVPAHQRRRQRLGCADLVEAQADASAELFEDLPVRPTSPVRVVGDDFLGAGGDEVIATRSFSTEL